MNRSHKKNSNRLYEIADRQQGYFTAKQAETAGFSRRNHFYHVRSHNWVREHRGVYRLSNYPITESPDMVLWYLWSCNRKGVPQGVYSHETALSFYELSDIMPAKLHMTVPKDFRRSSEIPKILVLHYGELSAADIVEVQGFRITKSLRSIVDLLIAQTVSRDILAQALTEGLERGFIARKEIQEAALTIAERKLLSELVLEVGIG